MYRNLLVHSIFSTVVLRRFIDEKSEAAYIKLDTFIFIGTCRTVNWRRFRRVVHWESRQVMVTQLSFVWSPAVLDKLNDLLGFDAATVKVSHEDVFVYNSDQQLAVDRL